MTREIKCPECGGALQQRDSHIQAPVTSEYGVHAHVDEGIAALIQACWRSGIPTQSSCQEDDPETGEAYIGFAPGQAERFVAAATAEDLDDPSTFEGLGWRMRGADTALDWRWQPGGFEWGVSFAAHFPPGDIPELVRRLERWR